MRKMHVIAKLKKNIPALANNFLHLIKSIDASKNDSLPFVDAASEPNELTLRV